MAAWSAVLITCLLFNGCVGKLPLSTRKDSASLGITVVSDSRTGFEVVESIDLTQVFFIRLTDKEDALTKKAVYKSNYYYAPLISGFQIGGIDTFLLGAEPGFYAAVGGIGKGHVTGAIFLIFFPERMIRETITEVKPNEFVYMGNYILKRTSYRKQMDGPDKIQNDYFSSRLFDEEHRYYGKQLVSWYISPQFHSPAMDKFQKSPGIEREFLDGHKGTFKSSEWADQISHRLKTLQK